MKFFKKVLLPSIIGLFLLSTVLAWKVTNWSTYDMIAKRFWFTSDGTSGGTSVMDINSGGTIIAYGPLLDGAGNNFITGSYVSLANSGVYFSTHSGEYFEANSGTYFDAHSGDYYNSFVSGNYVTIADSGTYYTLNPLGYITGVASTVSGTNNYFVIYGLSGISKEQNNTYIERSNTVINSSGGTFCFGGACSANNKTGEYNIAAGGYANTLDETFYSFNIAGKNNIVNDGYFGGILGGRNNEVRGYTFTPGFVDSANIIIGGFGNSISVTSYLNQILGGSGNSMGSDNQRNTIINGLNNTIGAFTRNNTVIGNGLTVNTNSDYNITLGSNATVNHDNTFIWSDGTTFSTTTGNRFYVVASRGMQVISGGIYDSAGNAYITGAGGATATGVDQSFCLLSGGNVECDTALIYSGGTTTINGSLNIENADSNAVLLKYNGYDSYFDYYGFVFSDSVYGGSIYFDPATEKLLLQFIDATGDYQVYLTKRGLEYNADYSSEYTDRSIVDKAYVDSMVTSGVVVTGSYVEITGNNVIWNVQSQSGAIIDVAETSLTNSLFIGNSYRTTSSSFDYTGNNNIIFGTLLSSSFGDYLSGDNNFFHTIGAIVNDCNFGSYFGSTPVCTSSSFPFIAGYLNRVTDTDYGVALGWYVGATNGLNGATIVGHGGSTPTGAIFSVAYGTSVLLPATLLNVFASGGVQIGNSLLTCGSDYYGSIKYTGGVISICNTLGWSTIATTNGVQTFTNKRYVKRVYVTGTLASMTPEIDNYDIYQLTALDTGLTVTNWSTSTIYDGDTIKIRLHDNGTGQALTWGTGYAASGGIALPTTTTTGKLMVLGFEWFDNIDKWVLLAFSTE